MSSAASSVAAVTSMGWIMFPHSVRLLASRVEGRGFENPAESSQWLANLILVTTQPAHVQHC